MDGTPNTTAYRITVTVESAKLPVDEDARNALLTEFRSRVSHLCDGLRGTDADLADIDVRTDYRYAKVPATCPLCSEQLDLQSIHLDTENGAFASAVCSSGQCGWSGDAVYRIIDLEGSESDAFESSVLTGDIMPNYRPYWSEMTEDNPTFTRIDPSCPRDDCIFRLGIGKLIYADEHTAIV